MAAAAAITVQGTIGSLPGGSRTIGPLTITSAAANGSVTQMVLQAGANTITTPTNINTTGCIIILPSNNTSATTLKGISGDTGIAIGKTGFFVLTWDSTAAPSSFVLDSVSTQTGKTTEIIYF